MTEDGVRVKFRVKVVGSRDTKKLMKVYGTKFSTLMSHCLSVSLSQLDYEDLPNIRKKLSTCTTISELSEPLTHASPSIKRMILDAGPIFNDAPRDLKAFILLAAGIRSHHLPGVLAA